ncbi:hypothetical protein RZS08_09520, partial [Arthrospira platensis SPKY1]|nr:hypothetical protein [Arthrospira platensis SPKY1]
MTGGIVALRRRRGQAEYGPPLRCKPFDPARCPPRITHHPSLTTFHYQDEAAVRGEGGGERGEIGDTAVFPHRHLPCLRAREPVAQRVDARRQVAALQAEAAVALRRAREVEQRDDAVRGGDGRGRHVAQVGQRAAAIAVEGCQAAAPQRDVGAAQPDQPPVMVQQRVRVRVLHGDVEALGLVAEGAPGGVDAEAAVQPAVPRHGAQRAPVARAAAEPQLLPVEQEGDAGQGEQRRGGQARLGGVLLKLLHAPHSAVLAR